MNGRDLESSELGLPGENVETPIGLGCVKPASNFMYDAEIVTKVSATDIKRQHKDILGG